MFEITRNSFAWLWTVTFFCSMVMMGHLDKKPADSLGPRGVRLAHGKLKRDRLLPRSFPACMSAGLGAQRHITRDSGDNAV